MARGDYAKNIYRPIYGNGSTVSPIYKGSYWGYQTEKTIRPVVEISNPDCVDKVRFAVWTTSDQSDLKWYDANYNGVGSYFRDIEFDGFKNRIYICHIYIHGKNGSVQSIEMSQRPNLYSQPIIEGIYWGNQTSTTFRPVIHIKNCSDVSSVKFNVWTNSNKSDMKSYGANFNGANAYFKDISFQDFKVRKYNCIVYVYGKDNSIQSKTFSNLNLDTITSSQKQEQSVYVNSFTKTLGDNPFSTGAKTSGNGKLTYSSSNTKVATVSSSGIITIKGIGTTTITVNAAATSIYKAASKKVTVTVQKGAQTISASNVNKTLGNKAFNLGAKLLQGNGKLSYLSSNKKVVTVSSKGKIIIKGAGTAKITIKASETSTYKGATKQVTVTIKPKTTSLSSLKNSKAKKVSVKWKRNSSVTGYQIQYTTKSDFSDAKTVTIRTNKTVSKTLSVTKGKTYYVRIRTYKGSVYSGWSFVKKVKDKK